MTKKEFMLLVKEPSLRKWENAQRQSPETFLDWWKYVGKDRCSFCNTFEDCEYCPVYDGIGEVGVCCNEWNNIYIIAIKARTGKISIKEAYDTFINESTSLYRRISEIEFEDTKLSTKQVRTNVHNSLNKKK